jgi:tetratricopeptide (TPR) repeat protein
VTSGDTISRYRILGPLGKGGMGVVYRAEDTRLHRTVALKFLPGDSVSEHDRQRFLNEAHAAAQLRHPNICPIHDIDEVDGHVFIAMACLDGESLAHRIDKGPLPVSTAIDITLEVLEGLGKAHELGIIHRDIKGSNIMISPEGHACVLDFGLAVWQGAPRVTETGGTVGTPQYMSPEQARADALDGRSDLWSVGVVLYEMLTGKLPFQRPNAAAVIHAILTAEPAPPSRLRGDVLPELDRVVQRALAKNPDQRWRTAAEMSAELRSIRGRLAVTTNASTQTLRVAPPPSVTPPPRRRTAVLLALACLLLAGAGFAAWKMTGPKSGREVPGEVRQVAVLPFDVIGTEETTRSTADGLVEIVTSALSEVEQLQGRIMAVPSSEIRRQRINSPAEAKRIYGVQFVITGSAQPLGSAVQFTANLVDTALMRQVRAKTFVYDPKDPIVSRNDAVAQVVRLLEFDLAPATRKALAAGDTTSAKAYAAYLEGKGLLARYDRSGNIDKAIASFENAIHLDASYALAYSGLGEAWWRKARANPDPESSATAIRHAERGVQLGAKLAGPHIVLGEVYGAFGRQEEGIRQLRMALDLAPGNPEAARELARIYTNTGHFAEAEASYVQATKARPTDWYGFLLLGLLYEKQERYAEAESALRRASVLAPDNDIVLRNLGAVYLNQGRYAEAVTQIRKSLDFKPSAVAWSNLASAYFFEHRFPDAVAAAETARDLGDKAFYLWGNLAIYYKHVPGSEAKSGPAFQRAIELAEKSLKVTPDDYEARSSLAEYHAHLGNARRTLEEIGRIPAQSRKPVAIQLILAYELAGYRAQAIEIVRTCISRPESLHEIRNDPDLVKLWNDPEFQKTIEPLIKRPRP